MKKGKFSIALWISYQITQKVSISNLYSSSSYITSGVPQGSILEPTLFNVFVNDLPDVLCTSIYKLFADDAKIIHVIHQDNIVSVLQAFQNDINRAIKWSEDNLLPLNVQECKTMTYSRQKRKSTNPTRIYLWKYWNLKKVVGWRNHFKMGFLAALSQFGINYREKLKLLLQSINLKELFTIG